MQNRKPKIRTRSTQELVFAASVLHVLGVFNLDLLIACLLGGDDKGDDDHDRDCAADDDEYGWVGNSQVPGALSPKEG